MKVKDVMTPEVATVTPDTSLKQVAELLVARRISGVPVCDAAGVVVGIVSEGDIVRHEGGPTERPPLVRLVTAADGRAPTRTAGEAMTSPAVTIGPERAVAAAAKLMVEAGVNRLPVVENGALVGIVSRADLVRAFVRSDEEIALELRDDVLERTLWLSPDAVEIAVADGEVRLTGDLPRRSDAELLLWFARRVPGVVSVDARLTWGFDDRARRVERSIGRR
jgi:CBS domain-containing protein